MTARIIRFPVERRLSSSADMIWTAGPGYQPVGPVGVGHSSVREAGSGEALGTFSFTFNGSVPVDVVAPLPEVSRDPLDQHWWMAVTRNGMARRDARGHRVIALERDQRGRVRALTACGRHGVLVPGVAAGRKCIGCRAKGW